MRMRIKSFTTIYNFFDIFLKNFYLFAPFIFLFLIQILTFWQKGTLFDFIYWTIYFPFFKASTMPGYILLPTLRQILPIAALFLLFTPAFFKTKFETNFLISTAFVSLFFAYPRFDYFHLIPSLALISVMFGENLKNLSTSNFPARAVFVFSLFFLIFFYLKNFRLFPFILPLLFYCLKIVCLSHRELS